jgi:hypothetical protein
MPVFITEYPQFFTASIKGRYKLLERDQYKDMIINSLHFLVDDKRIKLARLDKCSPKKTRRGFL